MPTIITSAAKEQPTAIGTTWLFDLLGVVGGFAVVDGVAELHFSTAVQKTEKKSQGTYS